MDNALQRVRDAVARIEAEGGQLSEEMQQIRRNTIRQDEARQIAGHFEAYNGGPEVLQTDLALETIVLRVGRPVLTVFNNEAQLAFEEAESEVWKKQLLDAKSSIHQAIISVGRIELENNSHYSWVGTGWLVAEHIIVTNRHVAEIFSERRGSGFVFRQEMGRPEMIASIDFIEEAFREEAFVFRVKSILHIEAKEGADLAFLQVEPLQGQHLPAPISLATKISVGKFDVAVIGYPARDSRIPDYDLMTRIFGDVYDKKRLAPGQATQVTGESLMHDCSTLGGNSGSVVYDYARGQAVGLHFSGRFLVSNYAVPATIIATRLRTLKTNSVFNGLDVGKHQVQNINGGEVSTETGAVLAAPLGVVQSVIDLTIPIRLTVTVDYPNQPAYAVDLQAANKPITPDSSHEDVYTEAPRIDYDNRVGYESSFLVGYEVPLPTINTKSDILTFDWHGNEEQHLKYQHFTVTMNRVRRMCIFSAVNIDGRQKPSGPVARTSWHLDPRIPRNTQIIKECYGSQPKFSRGHMTRREDPTWGDATVASLGNSDSMHVTNTVPQMQPFNGGIWLSLEDYALKHARIDDMRISVFTGPIFDSKDPFYYGVQIPVQFWKVIAFIHDNTQKLCATGYIMSQASCLTEQEFVFDQHATAQTAISTIENLAGLSFGMLTQVDPYVNITESLNSRITNLSQIQHIL